jgi:two-component system, chemotaxis family, sensor kinase Cph1
MAEKEATLTYSKLPVITGVPFLLKQLFLNLLRNSLKFGKPDVPPHIEITGYDTPVTLADWEATAFYKIDIKDNGIGFDNAHSESIFKVFSRLHTTAEYEGSGIGLALSKKIMQNHRGVIVATGLPGVGATFSLYFPVDMERSTVMLY